jgi:carbamate kinase
MVPSPRPRRIVEGALIRTLVDEGHLVIAAGGGGTPVQESGPGYEGLDVVIDKDRAAAVLARDIDAEVLLILTDVEGVCTGFGTDRQRVLRRLTLRDADELLESEELGTGTMAPKVEAAAYFLRHGGARAVIARLDQGEAAVAGSVGTELVP